MRERAMVVDDDVAVHKMLARLLKELDVDILPFFDAETALAHLEAEPTPPAFAILDIMLPQRNGISLAREIRARPHLNAMPILFLTAKNDATDEARAFELGAILLRKPFRLAPLRAAMRELILERRLSRPARDDAAPAAAPEAECRERILIVDDDPDIREALRTIVEEEGFEPLCAEDGLGALAIAGASVPRPSAALVDVMMPGLDGPTFTQRLKRAKPFESLPVIMISAFDSLEDDAARAGAVASLKKPFDVIQLLQALRSALASRTTNVPATNAATPASTTATAGATAAAAMTTAAAATTTLASTAPVVTAATVTAAAAAATTTDGAQ